VRVVVLGARKTVSTGSRPRPAEDPGRVLGLAVGVDRAGFEAQLEAQRERLRPKLGDDVQFEVLVEDGKVRLAARANRARPGRE